MIEAVDLAVIVAVCLVSATVVGIIAILFY